MPIPDRRGTIIVNTFADSVSAEHRAVRQLDVRPQVRTWWLVVVSGMLVAEMCLLTVGVEFTRGGMSYLASPRVASWLMMTSVLGLFLCGRDLLGVRDALSRQRWIALAVHVVLFALFCGWTRWLNRQAELSGVAHSLVWLWPVLGGLVILTALLSCFDSRGFVAWLRAHWQHWCGAAIIGGTFVMFVPDMQRAWHWTHPTTIAIAAEVLEHAQAKPAVVGRFSDAMPILGVRGGRGLTVTRFCAEMESIAAFWVLGGVLMIATWRSNRRIRLLAVVLLGTVMLYLLNGLRLAMLVGVHQLNLGGHFAVDLAHSRVSGVLFLGVSLAILLGTARLWHPAN